MTNVVHKYIHLVGNMREDALHNGRKLPAYLHAETREDYVQLMAGGIGNHFSDGKLRIMGIEILPPKDTQL